MPKNTSRTTPKNVLHTLNAEDISYGLNKIKKRIEEIKQFSIEERTEPLSDSDKNNIEQKVNFVLSEIFGEASKEYSDYSAGLYSLDNDTLCMGEGERNPIVRLKDQQKHISQYIENLETLAELMQERLEDLGAGDFPKKFDNQFDTLNLHKEVQNVAGELFKDRHYSQAIFEAVKKLEKYVKHKSNYDGDKIGTALMREIFRHKAPVLSYNSLITQTEKDEQEGLEHIFAGAILFIRNPRGHEIKTDDGSKALKYLSTISFLFDLVDECKPST